MPNLSQNVPSPQPNRRGPYRPKRSKTQVKRALSKAAGVYTDAAVILGVSRRTVERYVNKHPDLRQHVAEVETSVDDMAEGNVKGAIRSKDVGTSKWWLERKRRDKFSTRQEHTGPDGGPIVHRYAEGEIPDEQLELLSLADLAAIKRVGQLKRELRECRGTQRMEGGSGNPQAGV
jgi:hypothetical protein